MATATQSKTRKSAVTTKKKQPRSRPLLSPEGLKAEEAELRKKFPKIVPGSLRNRGDDPDKLPQWASKRTVEITCKHRGCKNTRRVATSDLHQVAYCIVHTEQQRNERKKLARKKKKAK